MSISRAEGFVINSIDRNYNKHNKTRKTQMEVLGGGISYAILAQKKHAE